MIPDWLSERIRGLAEQLNRLEKCFPPRWNTLAVMRHRNTIGRAETEYWRAKCHAADLSE